MRFADNYLNALMINRWGEGGYIRLARDAEAQVPHLNTETETVGLSETRAERSI